MDAYLVRMYRTVSILAEGPTQHVAFSQRLEG